MEENKVNLYFIPNTKNKSGGQFYNLYVNRGEKLDLKPFLDTIGDEIDKLKDEVVKKDKTFKSTGGMILKKDDEFQSVEVYSPNQEGINISPENQNIYRTLLELINLSKIQAQDLIETQQKIKKLTKFLGLDNKEGKIYNEKNKRQF